MRWVLTVLCLVGLALHDPAPAAGQAPGPAPVTREEFEALRKEVEELRGALREVLGRPGRAAPAGAADGVVTLASHPAKGSPDARLVLVDFTDYQ
jgi:hypothetical protein